jgi:hypothetical protein
MNLYNLSKISDSANKVLIRAPEMLEGLVNKIVDFNEKCIAEVEKQPATDPNYNDFLTMRIFFYVHAAAASRLIFEKTKDMEWAKKSYEKYLIAANSSKGAFTEDAFHWYSFAGDMAREIFKITGDVSWGEKSVEAYKKGIDIGIAANINNVMYTHSIAARVCFKLHEKTGKKDYARESFRLYEEAIKKSEKTDPDHSYHCSLYAAGVAHVLFEKTAKKEKEKWCEKAVEHYQRFVDYYRGKVDLKEQDAIMRAAVSLKFLRKYLNQ